MSGPRIVFLPHVHPDRWARGEQRHRRSADAEWMRHGATGLWSEYRTKADECARLARELRHLQQVVAKANAELSQNEQGGGRA